MRVSVIAAAAAALALTGPVLAQPAPRWDSGVFWRGAPDTPRERIQFLQDRIERGAADGSLDRREAAGAERELQSIRFQAQRMRFNTHGELRPADRALLQDRLDQLSRRLHWMRHNGW